jgi:hypothetical protein
MTHAERQRKYREKHADKINAYQRDYYCANQDQIRLRCKELYAEHRDSERQRVSVYYASRPDKRREKGKRDYAKMSINSKIASSLRRRIRSFVKQEYKTLPTFSLLGCSIDEFKKYMEGLFQVGMSWTNHGEWHIDHKRPCASFDLLNAEEQKQCFHFTNLQPLWAAENIKKGKQITDGFGNFWPIKCSMCNKNKMEVVRPGKVQCGHCG